MLPFSATSPRHVVLLDWDPGQFCLFIKKKDRTKLWLLIEGGDELLHTILHLTITCANVIFQDFPSLEDEGERCAVSWGLQGIPLPDPHLGVFLARSGNQTLSFVEECLCALLIDLL